MHSTNAQIIGLSSIWFASPTVWHCLVWQMTDLFMWSAVSHYGCLLLVRHVPSCVVFPGTFIKCLMAKNRGQPPVSSRLLVLANILTCADGKKMEGQLESNKFVFQSLAYTFLPINLQITAEMKKLSTTCVLIFTFWLNLNDWSKIYDDEKLMDKGDILEFQGFSLQPKWCNT